MTRRLPTAALILLLGALFGAELSSQTTTGSPTTPRRYETREHRDLSYGNPDAKPIRLQRLDLIVPVVDDDSPPPPLLVFFHGGSWRGGSPRWYRPVARALAARGVAVALPAYRLSPAVQHPVHVEDCALAVAWLTENAERFGFDADTFALGGHSAGGHLASLLATAPAFLAAHEIERTRIAGVVAISAPFDVCAPVGIFTSAFGDDRDDREEASPLRRDLEGAPPFLVLWADRDMGGLPMAARSMAKALAAAEVEHTALEIDDRDHMTIASRATEDGDPVIDATLEFLQRLRTGDR